MLLPFPEESWAKAEPRCYTTIWAELGSSAPCRLSEECTLIGGISTFLLTNAWLLLYTTYLSLQPLSRIAVYCSFLNPQPNT